MLSPISGTYVLSRNQPQFDETQLIIKIDFFIKDYQKVYNLLGRGTKTARECSFVFIWYDIKAMETL